MGIGKALEGSVMLWAASPHRQVALMVFVSLAMVEIIKVQLQMERNALVCGAALAPI